MSARPAASKPSIQRLASAGVNAIGRSYRTLRNVAPEFAWRVHCCLGPRSAGDRDRWTPAKLHNPVLLPTAVVDEFGRGRATDAAAPPLPAWVEVRALERSIPPLLAAHLDAGEASAIALALETGVHLVAIDERRGRLVARDLGLAVTGSVGLLLRAKRLGLIDAVAPRLQAMRERGIWLGEALVHRVLAEAREPISGSDRR